MFGDAAAQALKEGKGETRWEKMSKSKGNGVEPSHIVREVGVDAARLNVLFKVWGSQPLVHKNRPRALFCSLACVCSGVCV